MASHLLDVRPVSFRADQPGRAQYLIITCLLDPSIYDTVCKRRAIVSGLQQLGLQDHVDTEIRCACVRMLDAGEYPRAVYQSITTIVISRCCSQDDFLAEPPEPACCTLLVGINPEGTVGRLWDSIKEQLANYRVTYSRAGTSAAGNMSRRLTSERLTPSAKHPNFQPDAAPPTLRRSRRLSIMPEETAKTTKIPGRSAQAATVQRSSRQPSQVSSAAGRSQRTAASRRSSKPASPVALASRSGRPPRTVSGRRNSKPPSPVAPADVSSVRRRRTSPAASAVSSASTASRRGTLTARTRTSPKPAKPTLSPTKLRSGRSQLSSSFAKDVRARTLKGGDSELVVDFDVPASLRNKNSLLDDLLINPMVVLQTPNLLKKFSKRSQTITDALTELPPSKLAKTPISKDTRGEKQVSPAKSKTSESGRSMRKKELTTIHGRKELDTVKKRTRTESRSPSISPRKKSARPASPRSSIEPPPLGEHRLTTPRKQLEHSPQPSKGRGVSALKSPPDTEPLDASESSPMHQGQVPSLRSSRRNLSGSLETSPDKPVAAVSTQIDSSANAERSLSKQSGRADVSEDSISLRQGASVHSTQQPHRQLNLSTPQHQQGMPLLTPRSSIRRGAGAVTSYTPTAFSQRRTGKLSLHSPSGMSPESESYTVTQHKSSEATAAAICTTVANKVDAGFQLNIVESTTEPQQSHRPGRHSVEKAIEAIITPATDVIVPSVLVESARMEADAVIKASTEAMRSISESVKLRRAKPAKQSAPALAGSEFRSPPPPPTLSSEYFASPVLARRPSIQTSTDGTATPNSQVVSRAWVRRAPVVTSRLLRAAPMMPSVTGDGTAEGGGGDAADVPQSHELTAPAADKLQQLEADQIMMSKKAAADGADSWHPTTINSVARANTANTSGGRDFLHQSADVAAAPRASWRRLLLQLLLVCALACALGLAWWSAERLRPFGAQLWLRSERLRALLTSQAAAARDDVAAQVQLMRQQLGLQ